MSRFCLRFVCLKTSEGTFGDCTTKRSSFSWRYRFCGNGANLPRFRLERPDDEALVKTKDIKIDPVIYVIPIDELRLDALVARGGEYLNEILN
jgi:hypothetical protein